MALGLLGARGERHVLRRRSACDRAAFLGAGRTSLARSAPAAEEEEMTVRARPLPRPSAAAGKPEGRARPGGGRGPHLPTSLQPP